MNKTLRSIILLVVFVVCMALIIVGHKSVGLPGLGVMLIGLAGLLALLWIYNKRYQ